MLATARWKWKLANARLESTVVTDWGSGYCENAQSLATTKTAPGNQFDDHVDVYLYSYTK